MVLHGAIMHTQHSLLFRASWSICFPAPRISPASESEPEPLTGIYDGAERAWRKGQSDAESSGAQWGAMCGGRGCVRAWGWSADGCSLVPCGIG